MQRGNSSTPARLRPRSKIRIFCATGQSSLFRRSVIQAYRVGHTAVEAGLRIRLVLAVAIASSWSSGHLVCLIVGSLWVWDVWGCGREVKFAFVSAKGGETSATPPHWKFEWIGNQLFDATGHYLDRPVSHSRLHCRKNRTVCALSVAMSVRIHRLSQPRLSQNDFSK